ncbi:MAG: hypothetical protein MUF64_31225, partial [Polyangiaceae bacterium]|nr:hypothetical protein [Polyangiaceae bacterium]
PFCVTQVQKLGCGSCAGGQGGSGGSGQGGSGQAGNGGSGVGGEPFGGGGTSGAGGSGGAGGSSGSGGTSGDPFGRLCCGSESCDVPEVESCVCAQDPLCCNILFGWDATCQQIVEGAGCGVCSGPSCAEQGASCVDCCVSAHPAGYGALNEDVGACACDGPCSAFCFSACLGGSISASCSACLNDLLDTPDCPLTKCGASQDCDAYLSCVQPCPDP